ncbi:MAG: carboxypeptidase regulatory-like domain-containing protein [Candidatus Saccharimonadales bacterium]
MMKHEGQHRGFALAEMVISLAVIAVMSLAFLSLLVTLVGSAVAAKQRAVANALAVNQMEYLKSLSYDGLAVVGGSIIAPNPIPASIQKTENGVVYTITTSISYADDAYDSCGAYPTQVLKEKYCRNYIYAPGPPTTDTNPADYKLANVTVKNPSGKVLASLDTQISARVSETASTTGALFVTVTDPSGAPVEGATVAVSNTTLSPTVSLSDNTDSNGIAIFYGLPPDTGLDYSLTASKSGFSSLSTIGASGSLQPTYSKQKVLSQQSSYITLVIGPMSPDSLLIEATDAAGSPLAGAKLYVKGGYKKYTLSTNTAYYFDTMSPTDTRPTTDASGLASVSNLPPINGYYLCGVNGAEYCSISGTPYYLIAALPYGGTSSLQPIVVPQSGGAGPTYSYGGKEYIQKVRAILSTNSALPRIGSMSPDTVATSENLNNVTITIDGYNLSAATATLTQGATTFTRHMCNGNQTQLTCSFDLGGVAVGEVTLAVQNAAGTVTLPTTPLGGLHVK